jgi:hypothetical protein
MHRLVIPRQILGFQAKILGFRAKAADFPKMDIVSASLATGSTDPITSG